MSLLSRLGTCNAMTRLIVKGQSRAMICLALGPSHPTDLMSFDQPMPARTGCSLVNSRVHSLPPAAKLCTSHENLQTYCWLQHILQSISDIIWHLLSYVVTDSLMLLARSCTGVFEQLEGTMAPNAARQVSAALASLATALASVGVCSNELLPDSTALESGGFQLCLLQAQNRTATKASAHCIIT